MPLLLLRCAIIGKRSVITMEIDSQSLVVFIMDEIALRNGISRVAGGRVRLYVAKPNGQFDHPWLKTTDLEYEELTRGDARVAAAYVNYELLMHPLAYVESYFPGQPDAQAQTIHVLATLPTEDELIYERLRSAGYNPAEAKKELARLKGQTSLEAAQETQPEPEPFYKHILTPLRDSVASLAAWIAPPEKTQHEEKPKTKAA